MSTRITNALIEKIVENAIAKAGITQALTDWQADRNRWVQEARVTVNGCTDAEIKAAVEKLKKAYLAVPKTVRAHLYEIAHRSTRLYLNVAGASLRFDMQENHYVPADRGVIFADNPLCQQFYDQEATKKELDDRSTAIAAQVRAACKQVTTVKKLLEAWPEASELLPTEVEEAKINLPALVVADLNAMIGLPSEEAKAA